MRAEKQLLLEEIKNQIDSYGSFVIMNYIGLKANDIHRFRRIIGETGGSIEMVPKRMFVIAAEKAGYKIDLDMLTGHISVVFTGEDPMETTKAVFEYQKSNEDQISVIGGQIDGSILDKEKMTELSKLPGKEQLRAQFVGLLQAPMVQTVSAMRALVTSVIYCLDNKCKKEEDQN